MRNVTLHGLLQAFTTEASMGLTLAADAGEEMPFEVVETDPGGSVPLYCYRPLTTDFIRARLGMLVALATYAPAARALESVPGVERYLRARGETRIPENERDRADAALRCFLARMFADCSAFGFDDARFRTAYDELERSLYSGRSVTEVVAPMLGLDFEPDFDELAISDGLSIVRSETLADPPPELLRGAAAGGALLLVLRVSGEGEASPVALARARFRRVLTALRLFERGGYAVGPIGYARLDAGAWRPVALGGSGRPRLTTVIPAPQEDELRAFCNLIARRLPGRGADASGAGEVAWALSRFEMGCERMAPFEALSDHLLALRALLEPEGPESGRLAQRLSVICAPPDDRGALAERTARAISLERAIVSGLAPAAGDATGLIDELAEHLRAILRDVLCGHLETDVRSVADELLAEAAAA